jgi:hypothetical protein
MDDIEEKRINLIAYEAIISRRDTGNVVYRRLLDKINQVVHRKRYFR